MTLSGILRHDRLIVVAMAVISSILWYLNEPIIFTYDSFAYLGAAKALANLEGGNFPYFRAPLLPLLLAITGVPTSETYTFFISVQLMLGIGIILLMHACLRRISVPFGLISTLLFVSTFMAFVHSKAIMSEEIYLFGWCLCIDGVFAFLKTGTRWRLFEIFIALFILAMSRAQGAFIGFIVLPFIAYHIPKRIPGIIVGTFFMLSLIIGFNILQMNQRTLIDDPKTNTSVSKLAVTNTTGKMLFMVVYWDIYRYLNKTVVHPDNGPHSARLFKELADYYSVPENLTTSMDSNLFGRFEGKVKDLIQTMEKEPNGQYWWAIWKAMDSRLGAADADSLFLHVIKETILSHPLPVAVIYIRNFVVALFHADSSYVWAHPSFNSEQIGSKKLANEMVASGDSTKHSQFATILNLYFPSIQLLLLVISFLAIPIIWASQFRYLWLFSLFLIIYNHSTVALAATPESRYTFYVFPLLLVIMTITFNQVHQKRIFSPKDRALMAC